ncbi:hypothetical protein JCM19992_20290 [Thermostilla marina]
MHKPCFLVASAAIVALGTCLGIMPSCLAQETETLVQRFLVAARTHQQCVPPSHDLDSLSFDAAYCVQRVLAERLEAERGAIAGYKVAYASRAAQEQFGMNEPARGPLYAIQRLPSGSRVLQSDFNELMLEVEIAFTIGKRIDGPIVDVASLKPLVRSVHVAFDAGDFPYDSRVAKPTAADMIAVGTGSHRFVLGPACDPMTSDVDDITLTLYRNGTAIRTSSTREVLGTPWNSLLWCVNHLHRYGLTLEPGLVVLTGTAAPAYRVTGDDIRGRYRGEAQGLGAVELEIH